MPVTPRSSLREQAAAGTGVSGVVQRNIQALLEVRQHEQRRRSLPQRMADHVTAFAGSTWFIYIHAVFFGLWLALNASALKGVKPWDPFPFVMLAMITSVEAIFLSTFILITQNRMQRIAEDRAELDLQISLLTEHELTRAVRVIDLVARRLGVAISEEEMAEAKRDIDPLQVARQIERAEEQASARNADDAGATT